MSGWTPATAALGIICPRCGAKVRQACQTTSGRTAPVHSARFQPLVDAFGAGYEDGRADERWIAEHRGRLPMTVPDATPEAERCEVVRLADGSQVRTQGHLPADLVEAFAAAVKADEARRCHVPSDVPMPEIAQRIHGRETYWCGLYRGHDGTHRWPDKGTAIAEWEALS